MKSVSFRPGEIGWHLLAKRDCSRPNRNMPQLFMAIDTETNNSIWQAMLSSFTKALQILFAFRHLVDSLGRKITSFLLSDQHFL